MLITKKKFEEALCKERARVFDELERDKQIRDIRLWVEERTRNMEVAFDSRISKLEKAHIAAAENYSACKEKK